ncbi:MAG: glycyl-radical enzyme activating protein [Clostridiales bacterium]|nr:glycyl-radical enzyme activating protein [Clostridiales bacterium]
MKSLITNIQRMCMQDGPGIRTTVFMKGCTICCPWCSNPENISFQSEIYFCVDKCKRSGNSCVINNHCPVLSNEKGKLLYSVCEINALGTYGREYTPSELVEELCKDEEYFTHGGGVTFSGGEALAHMEYLEDVMILLKERNIHIAVQTALFISSTMVNLSLKYVDFFYIDIKILLEEECIKILGGDIYQFIKNVELIIERKVPVIFRIPCSDNYTLSFDNQLKILEFLRNYQNVPVELFKLHRMGANKYSSLGQNYDILDECSDERLQMFKNKLLEQNNIVDIISL